MKKVSAVRLSLDRVSWNEMFDSEQELIEKLLACNTEKGVVPKGYEFLQGIKRSYKAAGRISPKQMTQLKRLAKGIYASVNGLKIGGLFTRI